MPKNGTINRYFGDAIMKAVVLITCTKHKHEGSHKAEFLYSASENFVKYLECARLMADDRDIFIISALHCLLPLDKIIDSYECALTKKPKQEQFAWGNEVATQLSMLYVLNNTRFIVIADRNYCSALLPYLPSMDMPLHDVGCGPGGYAQLDNYVTRFVSEQCNDMRG